MSQYRYRLFDPVLSAAEADAMLRLCERFGRYKMYSSEAAEAEIGQGLAQRHDAVMNFIKTGGRRGEGGSVEEVVARTNYFREEYAYGDRVVIEGIEPFLHHQGFVEAAKAIHGRPVIEPAIVYANILVAGQELAVHTDVPEFRGANRRKFPQWLMVVMHHSGLFDAWRMPIVTAVSWWNRCRGGEFVYYPEGAAGAPESTMVCRRSVRDRPRLHHGRADRERLHALRRCHWRLLVVAAGARPEFWHQELERSPCAPPRLRVRQHQHELVRTANT